MLGISYPNIFSKTNCALFIPMVKWFNSLETRVSNCYLKLSMLGTIPELHSFD
jgi:hypothetical protein